MPAAPTTAPLLNRLAALQAELVEQACVLERQGRLDAADVAIATSARIAEVCGELEFIQEPGSHRRWVGSLSAPSPES